MNIQQGTTQRLCAICVLFSLTAGSELLAAITTRGTEDPTTTVTFDLSNFSDISVSGVYNVTISQDPDYLVEVTIDADVVDHVTVTQTGSRLHIGLLPGDLNASTIEAVVTLLVLNDLNLDGVIWATLRDFAQSQMTVDVAGVSQVRSDSLMISSLVADVSGVSGLDFGGSDPLGSAFIDVSGVSQATLNMDVESALTGTVTGTSTLFYWGTDVAVNVAAVSGGTVTRLGDTRGEGTLPQFQINAGLSGAWFDPDTPGQGFFLDVLPNSATMFVGWFTFDAPEAASSKAVLGDDNHRWLTAQGPFEGDTATLDVVLTTGGRFDDPTAIAVHSAAGSYGSVTVDFEDCLNAEVVYDLPVSGLSGTIPITRTADDNVALCRQLDGVAKTGAARAHWPGLPGD